MTADWTSRQPFMVRVDSAIGRVSLELRVWLHVAFSIAPLILGYALLAFVL